MPNDRAGRPVASDEDRQLTEVMRALRDGLGVEDMEVRGICSADYARGVISRLRRMGLLMRALHG